MYKSLYDISWQVSEPEYRQDSALSYSTIAKFDREGFNNLKHLRDRVETPSLFFGSAVDAIITGSIDEFNKLFMVADIKCPSDTLVTICKKLYQDYGSLYISITDIPDDLMLESITDINWNNYWRPSTRASKIKEECAEYYRLLFRANGRTIMDSKTFNDVCACVDALKSTPATKFYFEENNPFDNTIERFYQLKFKGNLDGIDYRCMAD